MRIRLPELMKKRDLTAYALSRRSRGRISMSTAYRLARLKGRLHSFDADMLEALCDIFGCKPGDLFERDKRS
ncbi:MAG TPA: helix-turn-helix transcriptional regulator [Gemmatimonadaceae bacterium]